MPELTQKQLVELRSLLETRRQELESQLEHGDSAAKPVTLDQQSVGRVSRIDAIQQQQMALASKQQATLQSQQIETALQRIENQTYGYCQRCGEPIAYARLQAQPFARLCIDCQSASEGS